MESMPCFALLLSDSTRSLPLVLMPRFLCSETRPSSIASLTTSSRSFGFAVWGSFLLNRWPHADEYK